MAGLQLVDLLKRYGNQTIVDHLTLDVRDGEFLTLLGPSGCGKTTTLRAIAGLVEIDGGEILFDRRRMNDTPPHRRSTAMVFQSYALFPHMSVRQNISFGLRMRRVSGREASARIDEAMALVGLEALGDRSPAQLSGGQQQRVALARAIVTRPDVLLFDEPLSNLDAKLRERLRVEIRELQQRLGITAIYVTHDQAEAMVMSDRIAVMHNGRIEQLGDPASIYQRPETRFTAEFIGQANILRATVLTNNGRTCELDTPIGRLVANAPQLPHPDEVLIAWRPEQMVPYTPGMANRIVGRIARSTFMGNLTEILVDVGGTVLRLEAQGISAPEEGSKLDLSIAEEHIQVLR